MKDRIRIMLGSREIVKRYIGSRLVWEAVKKTTERLLLTIRVSRLEQQVYYLTIYTSIHNTSTVVVCNKIQADNKPPMNLGDGYPATVSDTAVRLWVSKPDQQKRVEDYLSGATIVKLYEE